MKILVGTWLKTLAKIWSREVVPIELVELDPIRGGYSDLDGFRDSAFRQALEML